MLLLLAFSRAAFSQSVGAASVDAALSCFNCDQMGRADRLIDAAIAEHRCPGAVLLVGRGDAILYEKAYGNRALLPAPVKMTTDTIFDLASLTKSVATAPSIMLLYQRGKLRLDDPVAKYLPAFAANGKEKITIADLLLHIGGLMPDNDLKDYADGPKLAMERTLAIKPTWKPETRFAYSDVGYIVLGEVVRAVDGRRLDAFARDEIFRPLGMNDTGYLPSDAAKARCAVTQQRDGHWMVGEVHDPRAYALGGVAGHAGVFSTAEDLSRFCRMVLHGGKLGHARVFEPSTVATWIQPRVLPGGDHRTYGFDVDTPYAGIRGERFEKGTTFGHTGFTGTAFWLDPNNDCYFILLTNSVHPDGKGNILRLRNQVATAVAEALLGSAPTQTPQTRPAHAPATSQSAAGGSRRAQEGSARSSGVPSGGDLAGGAHPGVRCGIDILEATDFAALAGRKIGLITNQTGRDRDGNRTIDLLAGAKNLKLLKLFSPEHGIDGIFDQKVDNSIDAKTGLRIYSLYGATTRPTPRMLEGLDTLVFDIQDVGARFYTYSVTLGLCMRAAAEKHIQFVVLDRPNPNTGLVADGPLADAAHFGFTAFGALPLVHGMTFGELARFYNGEFQINCDLQVIAMLGWRRKMWWDETGLTWINPSPNLRNPTAALIYPAICLMEASNVSMGRGTDQPFEVFGAPWIDGRKLAGALNAAKLPGLRFVPIRFAPASSKFAHQPCQGVYIEVTDRDAFEPARAGVAIVWYMRHLFGGKFQFSAVDHLLQNSEAMTAIQNAADPDMLWRQWEKPIEGFRAAREKHLIYQ